MAKKRNTKKKNFLGAGALISGGLQLGGTLVKSILEKKRLEKENQLAIEQGNKDIVSNVNSANDGYADYIANHPELVHGTQKEIQALGDDKESIAGGMELVTAGTHESGNDLERRDDFVEGGEVLAGGDTHSNRIDAYSPAQFSASLGVLLDSVASIEKRATGATKGDLNRLGATVKKKIGEVTEAQEAIKEEYGYTVDDEGNIDKSSSSSTGIQNFDKPKHGLGELWRERNNKFEFDAEGAYSSFENPELDGDKATFGDKYGKYIGTGLNLASSVIDNIANARLLKQTPNVPKPNNYITEPLDTEIDVTDQLEQIEGERGKLDSLIDASTASSNTALQRKRASGTRAVSQSNRVLGQKERIETDLNNKEALNKQRIENMNKDLLNAYDQANYQRDVDILGAKSQNIANLSRDLTDTFDKTRIDKFQSEQLLNDALKYGDTGTIATAALQGNYDDQSNTVKNQIISSMESIGRTADAKALRSRWGMN